VLSTGSILHDHQYDWVREHVGDVPLQSISGGTDIIGCFVLGAPDRPVRRGWIQCRSLGLDVRALGGDPVGELVCANPFPSRPIASSTTPTARGSTRRTSPPTRATGPTATSSSSTARVTPACRPLRRDPQRRRLCASAGRDLPPAAGRARGERVAGRRAGRPDGARIVLVVVLRDGAELDGRLVVRLRREIARNASPAHVPDIVVAVDELPVTHSGKRSERAACDAVNGVPVGNVDALANPASLPALRAALARADDERPDAAEPRTAATTVERVIAIWEAVLGVAPLRADDAFFDVGGTSLAAVRVFQEIHDLLGVDLRSPRSCTPRPRRRWPR